MSAWPRGSSMRARLSPSACTATHSRFSSMVLPRGEGKPSTTRRSGSPAACASIVRMVVMRAPWTHGHSGVLRLLELFHLVGHPLAVVGRRLDDDVSAHAEMAEAAELRAGDLVVERRVVELLAHVFGRDGRHEPHRHLEARHGVLLDAHFVEPE